jgi:hypothetical protein
MAKVETSSVIEHSWHDCVEGFKQADIDMGSAFHRKLDWMNKAADIYLSEKNKMAGFVGKFADDCGISYNYGSQLNRMRNTFSDHEPKNFSHNTLKELLSAPEELREEIVSSGKPVTVSEVKEAKAEYKAIQEEPEYADLFEQVQQKEITPRQAIEQKKARMPVVPDYDVANAMGAIKGIAEMFGKRYMGSKEEAAEVLFSKVIDGYDQDEIGLSIARDYVRWFLNLKEVLDLAQPELEAFLEEKPKLKIVN